MINLKFINEHVSITEFSEVELPDFTIITGLNGSGKTHLLQAIEKKNIQIVDCENENPVFFDYKTFFLENENIYNAQQITNEKNQAWQHYNNVIKSPLESYRNCFDINEYQKIKNLSVETGRSFHSLEKDNFGEDTTLYNKYIKYQKQVADFFNGDSHKENPSSQGIYILFKKNFSNINDIEEADFIDKYKPYNFKSRFLPSQLGKVIWDYYVKLDDNKYNDYLNNKSGSSHNVISDEEFIKINGEKPWEVISKILQKFNGLDFTINNPEDPKISRNDNFQLKLTHHEKNIEVSFDDLSSGEKVLMALVASVCKASLDNHFPKILLLDEIDASLHPSMIQNLLEAINEIFLVRGTKVILVTHSPTTIALAPEENIYIMNKTGSNRIVKSSKNEALSILTEGFATLEEGLKLFDQISKKEMSIITEGTNAEYIKKAAEYFAEEIKDKIEIITGVEGNTGKNELKTLFEFFRLVSHDNKVLFVWDCDVRKLPNNNNKTYAYKFLKNNENSITSSGIENLFANVLFNDFKIHIEDSKGKSRVEFDTSRKKDFLQFILERGKQADFDKFKDLFEKISEILKDNK